MKRWCVWLAIAGHGSMPTMVEISRHWTAAGARARVAALGVEPASAHWLTWGRR